MVKATVATLLVSKFSIFSSRTISLALLFANTFIVTFLKTLFCNQTRERCKIQNIMSSFQRIQTSNDDLYFKPTYLYAGS